VIACSIVVGDERVAILKLPAVSAPQERGERAEDGRSSVRWQVEGGEVGENLGQVGRGEHGRDSCG